MTYFFALENQWQLTHYVGYIILIQKCLDENTKKCLDENTTTKKKLTFCCKTFFNLCGLLKRGIQLYVESPNFVSGFKFFSGPKYRRLIFQQPGFYQFEFKHRRFKNASPEKKWKRSRKYVTVCCWFWISFEYCLK